MLDSSTGSQQDRGERGLQRLPFRVAVLIALCALGTVLTTLVLETQAGATAYIVGESLWSKARQRALHALDRYLAGGAPEDLAEARRALDVPLGDRQARLALERHEPDLAAATAGFRRGGNDPRDIERMVWMYRLLHRAPYFRESVAQWRSAEVEILRMVALADAMERQVRAGPLTPEQVGYYQGQLRAIDARMNPLDHSFSRNLAEGSYAMRRGLLVLAILVFTALVAYALRVMRSTLHHVRETESEFRMAFHQSAVGMARFDRDGRITQANEALAQILEMPLPQLCRQHLEGIMLAEDLPRMGDGSIDWVRMLEQGERRLLGAHGRMRWVRWTASMVAGRTPAQDHAFVLVEDVSEAHALAMEMAHQASHDELTGLVNRREISRRLSQLLEQAKRRGDRHAVCYIDLDQFKLVNDTCGHEAGDRYLCRFAEAVQAVLRRGDWIGRLGGDEFAVLLHDTTLEQAETAMGRVYLALSGMPFHWDGRSFPLACSAGVVEINADATDVDWLLRAADTACYVAKEEGRNRVRCYRESEQTFSQRRRELDWVGQVRLAIAEGRMLLYAQKIEPVAGSGGSLRYEVLVRLRGDDGQVFEPGAFLPAIERYGQGMLVDRHVIDTLAAQLLADPGHLQATALCHVNISAQSVVDPSFLEHLGALLDLHPQLAARLCLEITETAVIGNMDDACRFIAAMRARGCRIALDDFGSGMSSFGYLKRLDVDILKVDGVFVRDMANGDGDLALLRSLVQVGWALDKEVVAEWVDSEQTTRRLALLGVAAVQGFGVHVPCPLQDLLAEAGGCGDGDVAGPAASTIMAP